MDKPSNVVRPGRLIIGRVIIALPGAHAATGIGIGPAEKGGPVPGRATNVNRAIG
jgi:hypothetical protein